MQDAGGELLLIGILRTSPFGDSANFAMKLSENPHPRANLLAIRRLIAA
jgi:hypothetical protein